MGWISWRKTSEAMSGCDLKGNLGTWQIKFGAITGSIRLGANRTTASPRLTDIQQFLISAVMQQDDPHRIYRFISHFKYWPTW